MFRFEDYLHNTHFFSKLVPILESRSSPEIRAKVKAMSQQEATEKAKLIMELVKQKLFTHFPMWRAFWSKMPPIASLGAGCVDEDGIGTMCTSGTAIFYDPKFVIETYEMAKIDFKNQFRDEIPPNAGLAIREGLRHPMDYSLFVIIHEILHCSLKHHLRMPEYELGVISQAEWANLWNIAADYEINHILLGDVKSNYYVLVPGVVRADEQGGSWKVPKENYEFFSTETAERIFWLLVRNIEEKRNQNQPEESDDEDEDGQPTEPKEDPGESSGEDGGGDGGEGGEGGEPGEGNGNGDDTDSSGIKPGDVIYNRVTGEYGVVNSVSGEMLDYDPISEDEARERMKK